MCQENHCPYKKPKIDTFFKEQNNGLSQPVIQSMWDVKNQLITYLLRPEQNQLVKEAVVS